MIINIIMIIMTIMIIMIMIIMIVIINLIVCSQIGGRKNWSHTVIVMGTFEIYWDVEKRLISSHGISNSLKKKLKK